MSTPPEVSDHLWEVLLHDLYAVVLHDLAIQLSETEKWENMTRNEPHEYAVNQGH